MAVGCKVGSGGLSDGMRGGLAEAGADGAGVSRPSWSINCWVWATKSP
jgi:hypothetical protein